MKRIKKFLVFGLVLSISFCLVACGSHTFSDTWASNETEHWHACTEENCTETKDKAEHTKAEEWVVDQQPTCTQAGKKHKSCTVCGRVLEEETIPALNHTFENHICTRCGEADSTTVAVIGSGEGAVCYTSIEDAIFASTSGAKISVYKNITIESPITLEGKNLEFDLRGHKISGTGRLFIINSGNVTFKNGSLESSDMVFRVIGQGTEDATLNLASDLNVLSTTSCCVFIRYSKASLFTSANLESRGELATISGNGSLGSNVKNITISGGTITATTADVTIYVPQAGLFNISGGTIIGKTALYIKSGTTTITGGNFVATGEKIDYVYSGNGCNGTGDAVVIDACGYPGGNPDVTITGGTFTSQNGDKIGYYKYNSNSANLSLSAGYTATEHVI